MMNIECYRAMLNLNAYTQPVTHCVPFFLLTYFVIRMSRGVTEDDGWIKELY